MEDLIAFLRARLDDDKRIARAASGPRARYTRWDLSEWHGREEPSSIIGQGAPDHPLVLGHFTEPIDNTHAEHIVRHDPARVLREVEAKRWLVDRAEQYERWAVNDPAPGFRALAEAARLMARYAALPYADHEDYRQEWRPEW